MKTITGEIRVFFIEFLHEHGESSRTTIKAAFTVFYNDMMTRKNKKPMHKREIGKRFSSNISDLANRRGYIVPHETAKTETYTLSENITKDGNTWMFCGRNEK